MFDIDMAGVQQSKYQTEECRITFYLDDSHLYHVTQSMIKVVQSGLVVLYLNVSQLYCITTQSGPNCF